MNYLTHQLLNAEEINFIEKELEQEIQGWEDGKKTAGSHASIVKNNLQLKRTSDISKKLSLLIKLNFSLLPYLLHEIFTYCLKGFHNCKESN